VFQGQTFGMTNLATFLSKYRVDSSLYLFHSKTNTSINTFKITPSVRLVYQWRDNTSFEAELGVEQTYTKDRVATTKQNTTREFMYIGYRWDF
jgi:hypothetical protein